jgi:hypothetical protein
LKRCDKAKSIKATKKTFHLVSAFAHLAIISPGFKSGFLGRNDWDETHIQRELSCLIAFAHYMNM